MIGLLLTNLFVIPFTIILIRKKITDQGLLKNLGLLEAGWLGFLAMLGLYLFFDTLEIKKDQQLFWDVVGSQKLILFTIIIGFGLIHLAILLAIGRKLLNKNGS